MRGDRWAAIAAAGAQSERQAVRARLAEALLRIPDDATAEALIAEKIATGNWATHIGHSDSLFLNASTWALMLTGNVIGLGEHITSDVVGWFKRLAGRIGESVARTAMSQAVRILGEGARTYADAARYAQAYRRAGGLSHGTRSRTCRASASLDTAVPRDDANKRMSALPMSPCQPRRTGASHAPGASSHECAELQNIEADNADETYSPQEPKHGLASHDTPEPKRRLAVRDTPEPTTACDAAPRRRREKPSHGSRK